MEPNPSGRTLVLLRHGHSAANGADTVSGWLDVPLSGRGCREAARAGALLAEHGCRPDVVHTSVLTRAIRTADLALAELGRPWPPVHRSWRLNERHYGALQGRARDALRAEYGAEQYALWRRSYRHAPPPLPVDSPDDPWLDHRYAALSAAELPRTESLADVRARLVPYWDDAIAPDLRAGRTTLVVAHGNSLRRSACTWTPLPRAGSPSWRSPPACPFATTSTPTCAPGVRRRVPGPVRGRGARSGRCPVTALRAVLAGRWSLLALVCC